MASVEIKDMIHAKGLTQCMYDKAQVLAIYNYFKSFSVLVSSLKPDGKNIHGRAAFSVSFKSL